MSIRVKAYVKSSFLQNIALLKKKKKKNVIKSIDYVVKDLDKKSYNQT